MKKLIILFAFFMAGINIGFCTENVLNSVELSQKDGAYELKLKTDAPIAFKKKIESDNSVYFDLKNISSPEKIETVYNDVADIDGVVIQQIDKNQIRIYVNGTDAASTKIISEAGIAKAVGLKDIKEIIINRPMSEYQAITGEEKYKETSDWEENGFNVKYLAKNIITKVKNLKNSKKVNFTLVLSIIFVLASIIGLKRAFSKESEDVPVIGINSNHKKVFDELSNAAALQSPQEELLEKLSAHNSAPTRPVNASVNNYAINSYQKNQNANPYNSGATISKPQRRQLPPTPAVSADKRAYTTNINPAPVRKQAPTAPQGRNIENIKFLESVTKIYEQSGRKDLANGLKANINKIKANI